MQKHESIFINLLKLPHEYNECNCRICNIVLQKLQELQVTYNQDKALILTEDDLKCQLFRLIYDLFPRNSETFNPEITGCSVHSEIKFFDELGKLTLRPDLIVIDPGNISIFHSTEYTMKRSGPEIFYGSGNVDFSTISRRPFDFIDE